MGWARFRRANGCIFDARDHVKSTSGGRVSHARMGAFSIDKNTQAVEYFVENFGAAFAPLLAGIIADATNLETSILTISVTAWLLCFFFYLGALFFIEDDIETLRRQMRQRAGQKAG